MVNKKPEIINQNGFTLIEMLVSIFIIALMSGAFLVNYRAGGKGTELKNTVQKMASDIRLAQNYCLGARDFNGAATPGGWGVLIEQNQNRYSIFADQNQNKTRQSAAENFMTISLPSSVEISAMTGGNAATIVFFPPDPLTYINGTSQEVVITLRDKNTLKTLNIRVNKFGLIEVE
jgi:prepilin-type N-terminal cleavage/methylation domain-containing protein